LRILVCTGWVPFVHGGSDLLADALCRELTRLGHDASVLSIPFVIDPKAEIVKSYLAFRLLGLSYLNPSVDRVITLKFPAFVIQHPTKVVWLVQQYRQVYDLFGTLNSTFGTSAADHEIRRAVRQMDSVGIGEAIRTLAISQNVADRLKRYNGLEADILYPPPPLDGSYHHAQYGDYVLSVGRLDGLKRVDRLVMAMGRAHSGVRCKIVGTGPEMERLKHLARRCGAKDRVDFLGYVDPEALLGLYASALAVYYGPLDEDYGLVTVEAMKSSKPVLTYDDSGGVLEFVSHGETGYVIPTESSEDTLAEICDALFLDNREAARMGANALDRVSCITWPQVIQPLLEG